jgi:hypothetical protein
MMIVLYAIGWLVGAAITGRVAEFGFDEDIYAVSIPFWPIIAAGFIVFIVAASIWYGVGGLGSLLKWVITDMPSDISLWYRRWQVRRVRQRELNAAIEADRLKQIERDADEVIAWLKETA